jgi:hypothetical protein
MNNRRFRKMLGLGLLLCGAGLATASPGDPGWPRHYSNGSSALVVYQPQVSAWREFKTLTGRCAFSLTTAPGRELQYGTLQFIADTLVDTQQRLVLMRNVRILDMRFPSVPGGASEQLSALTRQLLPSDALVVSLDRVLAFVEAGKVPRTEARVLTDPPPIIVSPQPAILVIVDGEPVLMDVENTSLRRVLNTNWELFQDRRTNAYYLRVSKAWLRAAALNGSFRPATDIPVDLARLVANDPKEGAAGVAAAPRVIVATKPSELIVIQGTPMLTPLTPTHLSSVANSESDLFFHSSTRCYYFLTSGRWFRATDLQGPWQYASASLPEDFKQIPRTHPRAHVLSAVPGTREAEDAVLLAAIPRTAEVKRDEVKAEVQYVGTPQFVPIQGTTLAYAKNTPNDVIRIGSHYYLCFQGVWFVSATANGPWEAASSVPLEMYSIPESSPKYHVTYVRIYESTPTTIVVGYTPGYYGAYVSGGVVVWGTGYYYPPYVAVGVAAVPVYWGPAYHTYGASAWYNPATGVYARGSAAYGPYGGYGAAAAYNPRTGTYAQGAAAWGPYGGVAAGRSYNPTTATYSAGYHAANPYGSWGQGVVGNGDNWARGGYQSGSRGTIAAGETSRGGRGVAVDSANGRDGYIAKSASGDIYAGTNGNVYKRDNGQWYQHENGSWNAMDRNNLEAQRQQAAAREMGNRNSQLAERRRSGSGGAARAQGIEQRPRFQGRRR